jgi:hypothetical protein
MYKIFWLEILKGREHSEDLGVGMDLREIVWEVVEWMHLGQNSDQWRVVVGR